MTTDENLCVRCHVRSKFYETFKTCLYCNKRHCQQCWIELQKSDDYHLFIDLFSKIEPTNRKRICSSCMKTFVEQALTNFKEKPTEEEQLQLALAISLSQSEAETRKKQTISQKTTQIPVDLDQNLLNQTAEAIERFMNRAKSNYQRHRDIIGDTALLSAFISLQNCANDLEQLKIDLHNRRQQLEDLQEKLTGLRDAREALNCLRFESEEKKRYEREQREQQRRLTMMKKVADLRQLKHTQLANYQENYFQRLLNEEQQMNERLRKDTSDDH